MTKLSRVKGERIVRHDSTSDLLILVLPEEHDAQWPAEVQEMWTERALMRLVFDSDLDGLFNERYAAYMTTKMCNDNDADKDKSAMSLDTYFCDTAASRKAAESAVYIPTEDTIWQTPEAANMSPYQSSKDTSWQTCEESNMSPPSSFHQTWYQQRSPSELQKRRKIHQRFRGAASVW